jgi:ligand-binding sensor domain-containing protein/two-component sensor histidine kinase
MRCRLLKCLSLVLPGVLLLTFYRTRAQRLNAHHYDTSNGLAHSRVNTFYQDAKGYLWFGTWEGLSRFDGYRFVSYDMRDGLGHVFINSIAEDRQGQLWVATNGGGVSRLIDDPADSRWLTSTDQSKPRKKFVSFRVGQSDESNRVNVLVFDSDDRLWCGTDDGIYRSTPHGSNLDFELIVPDTPTYSALHDRQGHLWFGCEKRLIEFIGDDLITYDGAEGITFENISSLAEDHSGRLFLTNDHGLFEHMEAGGPRGTGRWKRLPLSVERGLFPHRLLVDSDGTLLIASTRGLIKYKDGQELYRLLQPRERINAIYEDRNGNLWVGTWGSGVLKLDQQMAVNFTRTEGLPDQYVVKVIESHEGRVYASTSQAGLVELLTDEARTIPHSQNWPFNTIGTRLIQDRRNDWWVGNDEGVYKFRGPALQLRSGNKIPVGNEFRDIAVSTIYEDPNGRIWVGSNHGLYYSDSQTGNPVFNHLPLSTVRWPVSLVMDQLGVLWVSGFGGLARVSDSGIRPVQATSGLPETETRSLFIDSRGWLWIGLRNHGISMTRNPVADSPEFFNFSTRDGLASDFILSIAEDDSGQMYLGTFKGFDQLDPFTGQIQHFTEDGLAGEAIEDCIKDRRGYLWIATNSGVSRLKPGAERERRRPSAVYLNSIQIAGEDLPVAETGTTSASVADLPASRNNLSIEFVALSFASDGGLKYQYKLEGADVDWSAPTEQRKVNYARLAPGTYRFLVRAMNRNDAPNPKPAVFEFRILPPVWQRWWFLTLAGLSLGVLSYVFYKYRVNQLLELERVRTRIASDLHDDIGSNLSLISGLSEVLGQSAPRENSQIADRLSVIANASRQSVEAMGDIVWAVNPKRDNIVDLAHRMRRFASDVLTARDIEFHFNAPSLNQNAKMGAESRREIFLIFKEAINNIARHSGCKAVDASLNIEHRAIILKVSDNGHGFDQANVTQGHGLDSMRRRAEKLGGQFELRSIVGAGAKITLYVPFG